MRGVTLIIGFGSLLALTNGCYTIVSNSNNVNGDVSNITVINYPPPPPIFDPIIVVPPSLPPAPPYKERPVVTRPPEERPKWNPSYGKRDPLRGHGEKGTTGHRTSDTIKRDGNKTGSRR
ncbi:MAG: hypothetical protein HKP17_09045 [Ignavibacteriaceae bacterium]|nr:hypothetical protein [Ignavibacteria bacterium]MBT8391895.1 hypothetical protein [Ignavibacteria bacterium]NNJ53303.1 hypothetical protein [Ignavibacteriaceae bacterium]NNL22241.1 hypothetical protein [Ignavibacteriaceae bacterium]